MLCIDITLVTKRNGESQLWSPELEREKLTYGALQDWLKICEPKKNIFSNLIEHHDRMFWCLSWPDMNFGVGYVQERIREMPGLPVQGQAGPQFRNGPLTSLPGSESNLGQMSNGQVHAVSYWAFLYFVQVKTLWVSRIRQGISLSLQDEIWWGTVDVKSFRS